MIDLHSHILPGIDDGAADIEMSVEMARLAVADGTSVLACTPHFMPGIYDNSIAILNQAISTLRLRLNNEGIPLRLISGGDVHASPDLSEKLLNKSVPTLAGTKYFLFEPPHHVLPPNLDKLCRDLIRAGFIPILTHPERLSWIENHYDVICKMEESGVPIQLTAKSVIGEFGKRPKYWSDRMLDEGRVDLIASDAHNLSSRPPGLRRAKDAIQERLGEHAAHTIVYSNPENVLKNEEMVAKKRRADPQKTASQSKSSKSLFSWFKK